MLLKYYIAILFAEFLIWKILKYKSINAKLKKIYIKAIFVDFTYTTEYLIIKSAFNFKIKHIFNNIGQKLNVLCQYLLMSLPYLYAYNNTNFYIQLKNLYAAFVLKWLISNIGKCLRE